MNADLDEAQGQMRQRQLPVVQEFRPDSRPRVTPYSIYELVELHGLSRRTVILLYENEAGVQILNRPEAMHKRRYRTMRVPHQVYQRVKSKLEGGVSVCRRPQ